MNLLLLDIVEPFSVTYIAFEMLETLFSYHNDYMDRRGFNYEFS